LPAALEIRVSYPHDSQLRQSVNIKHFGVGQLGVINKKLRHHYRYDYYSTKMDW